MKVSIIDGSRPHQIGNPTNTTLYCAIFSIFDAIAGVRGVAFNDCAVNLFNQFLYQFRPQVICLGGFAGTHFYSNLARRFPIQCIVCTNQSRGRYITRKIYNRHIVRCGDGVNSNCPGDHTGGCDCCNCLLFHYYPLSRPRIQIAQIFCK